MSHLGEYNITRMLLDDFALLCPFGFCGEFLFGVYQCFKCIDSTLETTNAPINT